MGILTRARKLERRLTRSIDAALGEFVGTGSVAPLEIVQQVLDRAEQEIQHTGRGRRAFPYTRVKVLVQAAPRDRQARARFAAVAEGPPSLEERLRVRLQEAGCPAPALSVDVAYVSKAGAQWMHPEFHVVFARDDESTAAPAATTAAAPSLKLTVLQGKASHRTYVFQGGRVDIGRRTEVLDARQRLVRTNQLAFDENGPEANRTVSRRHAHVIYDPVRRDYRLLDDRSAHGTGIVRDGRTIPVPPGSRGVGLRNGDEILLGEARVRVALVQ